MRRYRANPNPDWISQAASSSHPWARLPPSLQMDPWRSAPIPLKKAVIPPRILTLTLTVTLAVTRTLQAALGAELPADQQAAAESLAPMVEEVRQLGLAKA